MRIVERFLSQVKVIHAGFLGATYKPAFKLKKGIQRDVRSYSCKHITKTDKHEKGYSMVLKSKDRAAMTLMSVIISAATFNFSTLNCGFLKAIFAQFAWLFWC